MALSAGSIFGNRDAARRGGPNAAQRWPSRGGALAAVGAGLLLLTQGCSETESNIPEGGACVRSVQCAPGLACVAGQCSSDLGPLQEAGTVPVPPSDAGPMDAGPDASAMDSGSTDAGAVDAGPPDSGPQDAGPSDSGPSDSGPTDSGVLDSG